MSRNKAELCRYIPASRICNDTLEAACVKIYNETEDPAYGRINTRMFNIFRVQVSARIKNSAIVGILDQDLSNGRA